jgi:hypothetical protein
MRNPHALRLSPIPLTINRARRRQIRSRKPSMRVMLDCVTTVIQQRDSNTAIARAFPLHQSGLRSRQATQTVRPAPNAARHTVGASRPRGRCRGPRACPGQRIDGVRRSREGDRGQRSWKDPSQGDGPTRLRRGRQGFAGCGHGRRRGIPGTPSASLACYGYWSGLKVERGELYRRPGLAAAAFPTNEDL